MPTRPVLAAQAWKTNGHLIADVARLGYLKLDDHVLDPTFGRGTWWRQWRPHNLTFNIWEKGGFDFRHMPYASSVFNAVAFDPPYKLNGTPTKAVDERYGVDVVEKWQQRHQLIMHGMSECARVLKPKGILLLKCQDQVCSGAIRWQTDQFTEHAIALGLQKIDRFDMLGTGRSQPPRTRKDGKPSVQQHAYGRPSTLLVFRARSAGRGR